MSWFVRQRRGGEYPPDSRVFESCSEIRYVDQVSHRLLQLRLLTSLKMSYEAAKKRAEPYTKIVGELPDMRRETVQIVQQAVQSEGRHAYVLVSNRSEGLRR